MDDPRHEQLSIDVEQLLKESQDAEEMIAGALERQRAVTERLIACRDAMRASETASSRYPRYRNAAEAFKARRYPFSNQKVRLICRNHSVLGLEDTFALKPTDEGPWLVQEPEFSIFADRVDRGLAKFRSSRSSTPKSA